MHLSSSVVAAAFFTFSTFAFPLDPDNTLDKRALACKGAFQCRNQRIPANSGHVCVKNVCTYVCNAGYTRRGVQCVLPSSATASTVSASATTTTTSAATTILSATATSLSATEKTEPSTASSVVSTSATKVSTASSTLPTSATSVFTSATTTTSTVAIASAPTLAQNALAAARVTGFPGTNTNAIISWFHTNSTTDSTNGNSWCGFKYSDAVPGFAPSLATMLANFNGSYVAAATAYCGLEAVVTTPDGRTATLYLADAFDDAWVRTPSSLDVVYGSFPLLFGSVTDNKNDVVKNATWYFTGARNERYKYKGLGSTGL
ncbi:hypothetical protein JCM5296_001783 [Sporobolomyces johnsonii]